MATSFRWYLQAVDSVTGEALAEHHDSALLPLLGDAAAVVDDLEPGQRLELSVRWWLDDGRVALAVLEDDFEDGVARLGAAEVAVVGEPLDARPPGEALGELEAARLVRPALLGRLVFVPAEPRGL